LRKIEARIVSARTCQDLQVQRCTAADFRARPVTRHHREMAALFGVDAFAGGPVVNALVSLWLLERFESRWRRAGSRRL
jgi:hypothetical protein